MGIANVFKPACYTEGVAHDNHSSGIACSANLTSQNRITTSAERRHDGIEIRKLLRPFSGVHPYDAPFNFDHLGASTQGNTIALEKLQEMLSRQRLFVGSNLFCHLYDCDGAPQLGKKRCGFRPHGASAKHGDSSRNHSPSSKNVSRVHDT